MKFSSFCSALASATVLLASLATASMHRPQHRHRPRTASGPTPRDAATTGYATLNGGTTGGVPGPFISVSTLPDLIAAVSNDNPTVVLVQGAIKGDAKVNVGSNKSIIGQDSTAVLEGIALCIQGKKNVIIRNLAIRKVPAHNGDAIAIDGSMNVWVDHCDLSSDLGAAKGTYAGLLTVTHGADFVTVSHTYFHNHCKASVVGGSDDTAADDSGKLHVTFHDNLFQNVRSAAPTVRFGTVHIFNSIFSTLTSGIATLDGAQLLIERCSFTNVPKPILSPTSSPKGFAVERDLVYTGTSAAVQGSEVPGTGSLTSVPYAYTCAAVGDMANMAAMLSTGTTVNPFDSVQGAGMAAVGASLSLLNVG